MEVEAWRWRAGASLWCREQTPFVSKLGMAGMAVEEGVRSATLECITVNGVRAPGRWYTDFPGTLLSPMP